MSFATGMGYVVERNVGLSRLVCRRSVAVQRGRSRAQSSTVVWRVMCCENDETRYF